MATAQHCITSTIYNCFSELDQRLGQVRWMVCSSQRRHPPDLIQVYRIL